MGLTTCMIVLNEEETLRISLRSALSVSDEVVIGVDNRTVDGTLNVIKELNKVFPDRIKCFNHDFGGHFGKARQTALELASNDWVLWLDADECLGDDSKGHLEQAMSGSKDAVHVQYVHFVHDFAHIDNSEPVHFGLFRLFKKNDRVRLDLRENHCIPSEEMFDNIGINLDIKIFHLGYLRGMFKVRERYLRNVSRSTIHNPVQVDAWKYWHYFNYPTREYVGEIPLIIKEEFRI